MPSLWAYRSNTVRNSTIVRQQFNSLRMISYHSIPKDVTNNWNCQEGYMNSIWEKWKQYLVDLITNLIFSYAIDCIIAKLRKQAKYKLQYTSNIIMISDNVVIKAHLVYSTNWGQCLFSTLKQDTDNKQIGYSMILVTNKLSIRIPLEHSRLKQYLVQKV